MLYLNKQASNTIVLRLTDLVTPMPSVYTFVFRHEQQKVNLEVDLTDISDFGYRYSQFVLTLPDDLPDMTKEGEYSFIVNHEDVEIYKGKAILNPQARVVKTHEIELGNNKIHDDK